MKTITDPIDDLYIDLETDEDFYSGRADLEAACDKIVEWWMEDYSFEELLEEFNVTPSEAFFALVKLGLIDEDTLLAYLSSD